MYLLQSLGVDTAHIANRVDRYLRPGGNAGSLEHAFPAMFNSEQAQLLRDVQLRYYEKQQRYYEEDDQGMTAMDKQAIRLLTVSVQTQELVRIADAAMAQYAVYIDDLHSVLPSPAEAAPGHATGAHQHLSEQQQIQLTNGATAAYAPWGETRHVAVGRRRLAAVRTATARTTAAVATADEVQAVGTPPACPGTAPQGPFSRAIKDGSERKQVAAAQAAQQQARSAAAGSGRQHVPQPSRLAGSTQQQAGEPTEVSHGAAST